MRAESDGAPFSPNFSSVLLSLYFLIPWIIWMLQQGLGKE